MKILPTISLKHLTSGIVTLLILLPLLSCKDKKTEPADSCEDVFCQAIFKFALITVKDVNGQPYALDNYYTIKQSTREEIKFSGRDVLIDSLWLSRGLYPVLSDNQMDMTTTEGVNFEFHGFKNGNEVINKTYKINHNCCNINLISGPTEIIVSE